MTSGIWPLPICGEELLLHPDRAVIWPRCHTVVVADTHFGKSSYFGRHGIPVPAGTEEHDRDRIERLLVSHNARRLVILGDFLHSATIEGSTESDRLKAWVETVGKIVEIHVVAGNHDRGDAWIRPRALRWWNSHWTEAPFRFVHDVERDRCADAESIFTLSGHVHPVFCLRQGRKVVVRVPAFWQHASGLVLPSFGSFTGGFAVRPTAGHRLFAVGPRGVEPCEKS